MTMAVGNYGNRKPHSAEKRGRTQLRSVTRVGKRQRKQDVEELSIEPSEAESEEEDEEYGQTDNRQAYNALMVLLKSESHTPRKVKKQKVQKPVTEYVIEEEDDEDESQEQDLLDAQDASDSDTELETSDPFEIHFNTPDEDKVENFDELVDGKWPSVREETTGYMRLAQYPDDRFFVGTKEKRQLHEYNIKSRILEPFLKNHQKLTETQKLLMDGILKYMDVLFPYKDYIKEFEIRDLYCLHAVNHVLKTRDRVLKNNIKLSSFKEQVKNGTADELQEPEFRDQGFNRPKVLIVLPTRQCCYEVVEKIIQTVDLKTVENKKRFLGQYKSNDTVPEYKTKDFKYLFDGNSNDFFCLGMKFTRRTLKLYSSFNQSDIIFGSPLGLKTILQKGDQQFLSSIEVTIFDQANSLQYQNWANVSYILGQLNKIPETYSEDLDFSRIRMWAINDKYKYLRQNLVFCKFLTPEINSLFSSSMNLSGKLKYKPQYQGSINEIVFKVKQIFQRFESPSPLNDADLRFNYFKSNVVPMLTDEDKQGILLYIPDYNDYVRVKNYLKFSTSVSYSGIDEYTSQAKQTKARAQFQNNKVKVMLYTERLHHYNRFDIKGTQNIVFYQPPSNELYYSEIILRFLGDSMLKDLITDIGLNFVRVLYSKWDATSLERIVGTKKVPRLCYDDNEIYEFK